MTTLQINYNELINVNTSDYTQLESFEIVEQIEMIFNKIKLDTLQFKLSHKEGFKLTNKYYNNLSTVLEMINDNKTFLLEHNYKLATQWHNAYNSIKRIFQNAKIDIVNHYHESL